MKKFLAAAATAVMPLAFVVAQPTAANAAPDRNVDGYYRQSSADLTCVRQVLEDGDGGVLSVRLRGFEVRPEDQHMRTDTIRTRLVAQEQGYRGRWHTIERSRVFKGRLGRALDRGAVNRAPFVWNGAGANPVASIGVAGVDDLFRVVVMTRLRDDEGSLLATLRTVEGTCRL
jgi:hypothetical protein